MVCYNTIIQTHTTSYSYGGSAASTVSGRSGLRCSYIIQDTRRTSRRLETSAQRPRNMLVDFISSGLPFLPQMIQNLTRRSDSLPLTLRTKELFTPMNSTPNNLVLRAVHPFARQSSIVLSQICRPKSLPSSPFKGLNLVLPRKPSMRRSRRFVHRNMSGCESETSEQFRKALEVYLKESSKTYLGLLQWGTWNE